ncbi:unnamed protein product [Onchocerca ochengi]|uniref:Lysozyme n=2 Tax=Onchocerca TaxID=6281 RepID=A0A182EQH5_ONCOC|nr:unnamed protein product [Onchocerca ochengi]
MIVDSLTTNLSKIIVDSKVKALRNYYEQAVDVANYTNQDTFRCLKLQKGISTAFVRVFRSTGNGYPDINAIANIYNAAKEGLGVEIYIEPQPCSTKSGNEQFMETYNFLKTNDIVIRSIWIKITLPIIWPNNQDYNIQFINQFITSAQQYALIIGIYTNWYDWQQITAGWSKWSSSTQQLSIRLWYWNMLGSDWYAATTTSFDDFRSFGGFNEPLVKQYVQNVHICQIYTSLSIYINKISMKALAANLRFQMANITVGNLGFYQ